MVSNIDGVSRCGESGSHDTSISGLLLTIAHISDINVVSSSCVKSLPCRCKNIAFNIRFTVPINLSHTPPMCGACGGLNFQVVRLLERKSNTGLFSINSASMVKSSDAPTKLVPRSERNWVTGPRMATKRLSALMNDELVSCSMISM